MQAKLHPPLVYKSIKVNEKRGSLKIFFGYAAGVGKTYAMLTAAHKAKEKGIDVVIGYVEPHARKDTSNLTKGLESIPTREVAYHAMTLQEFDLERALERKPQLILVDELAHTNAQGSTHQKRYQDVEELLKAGIDVYTTINVQHIESLNNHIESITGICVKERIPDSIFQMADQVEIVDIEPVDLLERLKAGKIYRKYQAQNAMNNFFTLENLTALREIALRCCADQINLVSEDAGIKSHDFYHTEDHILVCLSSSPTNDKLIRTASRMANAFKGKFTAIYVETSDFQELSSEDRARLRTHIRLAEQLGATIELLYGDDVSYQIAEYAKVARVSKIVLGRSNTKKSIFHRTNLVEQLIKYSPDSDIYIIPDIEHAKPYVKNKKFDKKQLELRKRDIITMISMIALPTFLCFVLDYLQIMQENGSIIYMLAILVVSIVTSNRFYSILTTMISVGLFNYFFINPKYNFHVYNHEYILTFVIMIIASIMTSTISMRLKQHAKQSADVAYKVKVLLEVNQLLQKAQSKKEVMEVTANQVLKLVNKDIVFYLAEEHTLLDPIIYSEQEQPTITESEVYKEKAVALWVLNNNKHAGASTQTLSNSKCLYLAIRRNDEVYGVVGIHLEKEKLETFEKNVLLSILGECALALENTNEKISD